MPSEQPNDFALIVGIDHYPNFGQNGRNLKGAINDAQKFANWVKDKNTGGGVKEKHCKLVTSEGNVEKFNKDIIDDALDEIWGLADAIKDGGRRLYMFFSGHGQQVDNPDFLTTSQTLCLPKWSFRRPNAAILTDSYSNVAKTCLPFKEIVVFMDCCRVSTIRIRADQTSLHCLTPQNGHHLIKKQIFYPAEPMTQAFEQEGEIVHGYFTTALINGLKQGSHRADGGISAHDLAKYLKYWVPTLAKENNHEQNPQTDPIEPFSDMIFGTATPSDENDTAIATHNNFEIRFHDWRDGIVQLIDSNAELIREGNSSTGPWSVHLEPGLNLLLDLSTNDQLKLHFRPEMEGSHVTF